MKIIALYIGLLIFIPDHIVWASELYKFNSAHLHNAQNVDLTQFKYGNPLRPGAYKSQVYINEKDSGESTFSIVKGKQNDAYEICVTKDFFNILSLKNISWDGTKDKNTCMNLSTISRSITWNYKSEDNILYVSIPQELQVVRYKGSINPANIDSGVPAVVLRYTANSYESNYRNETSNYTYVGIDSSLRISGWNLYHQANFQSNNNSSSWENITTYAEKALFNQQSTLRIGKGWSDGTYFDSLNFTGVKLATDQRMLPSSRRGFAPVISGVAHTNARVTVTQNGVQIYEATVPPGNFSFSDLYPTNAGTDLIVTINEADGRKNTYTVPYSSIPGMVRNGALYYDFYAGQIDESGVHGHPEFSQLLMQYGFNNTLSIYAGLSVANDYFAILYGNAFNTSLGALSIDLTHSVWDTGDLSSMEGSKVKINSSKNISYGTKLILSYEKVIDKGYISLRDSLLSSKFNQYDYRVSARYAASITQQIFGGTLSLSGVKSKAYNNKSDITYQFGYSGLLGRLGYYIYTAQSKDINNDNDNIIGVSFSLPLGKGNNVHTRFNHSKDYGDQFQSSFTGYQGVKNNIAYGVTTIYDRQNNGGNYKSIGANGSIRNDYSYLNASISAGDHQQQFSAGASGALIATQDGFFATPELGDTFAIIEAPHATGAKISNQAGQPVSSKGYAIVPYLNPFTQNWIDLDPNGAGDNVEILSSSTSVVPDAGAAIKVKFKTRQGIPLFLNVRKKNGDIPPLGSKVFNENNDMIGYIGQGGLLYARVASGEGVLKVMLDFSNQKECKLHYIVNDKMAKLGTPKNAKCF
ncbi:fimbria/pilus outer membrane usher protein [Klebsiella pneumoniae]|nr:fimbrial biogenesis outer membrane usher protein [Klebsiella pneumoniae]